MARKNKGCVHYVAYRRNYSFVDHKWSKWTLVWDPMTPQLRNRMMGLSFYDPRSSNFDPNRFQWRKIEH